jgi:hypothetical protein
LIEDVIRAKAVAVFIRYVISLKELVIAGIKVQLAIGAIYIKFCKV